MIIKENDLINFISCPIKCLIYKNNKVKEQETYNSLLHEMYNWTINNYYFNGIENLDERINKQWDKTCIENQDIISSKKVIEGWGLLYKVYEYLRDNKSEILDVNIPYNIEIPETGFALTGQIDMIASYGDDIEIFVPNFSKKMPESYYIDFNIKHTIDAYVIKELYNKNTFITYHNYFWDKNKYTLRNQKDFNRLKKIVSNIGHCIKNDIYYPHSGYHCTSCLARGFCSEWGKE